MEAILINCVQNSCQNFLYNNSLFMCERLCAEFPTEMNLQLLAGCYLQNNQAYCAYQILKGTQMAQSRYLFAMSCFKMDLLTEAESALCPVNDPSAEVPNGAAGQYLLGLIYRYTDRRTRAIHRFKQALSIDPLLWAAYEELCTLGSAEEAAAMFGEAATISLQKQHIFHLLAPHNLQTSSEDSNSVSTESFIPAVTQSLNNLPSNVLFYTPSPLAIQLSGSFGPPPICRNMKTKGPQYSSSLGADSISSLTVNSTIQAPRRKVVDEKKLRKVSSKLFSGSGPRRGSRLSGDVGINTTTSVAGGSCNGSNQSYKFVGGIHHESFDDSRSNSNSTTSTSAGTGDARSIEQGGATVSIDGVYVTSSKVLNGASEILGLLTTLGEGYRLSCLHRCQDALNVYGKLPLKHYHTGWVLSQVGKAYFELVDYLEADRAFSLARRASPYSLEGMDIYSTVLYHLNEDMKLSYLAQELISTDRLAPQSWCAMGNCYSFKKDHETALKLFQRAVQLNSRFAYAHTLCGHEHVALEDYEKGIKSYHSALQIDARHYNSWYGIGMIYLRQEKFEFSEHHFRMALQINPYSSVLMSYLGAALHSLKRSGEALEIMEKAILTDKKNPLPIYQKANILVSIERYDEALKFLEELKEHYPRESSVYALMGRIYKRYRMFDKAMLHFGIALDLKPSATDVATIKCAIEKLHIPDEIEDNL